LLPHIAGMFVVAAILVSAQYFLYRSLLLPLGDFVNERRIHVLLLWIEILFVLCHVILLKSGSMSCAVAQIGYTGFGGAVVTAEHSLTAFQSVSDDADAAMRTSGCQLMDRAFEAVKRECFALSNHLKVLVVVIAA